jgi:hypothetical protein
VRVSRPDRSSVPARSDVRVPSITSRNGLGKRYTDASGELERPVTKAGPGTLVGGEQLVLKAAKPVPASD